MDIIVISRPDYFDGEARKINQLFEQGMEILHLRKPGCTAAKLKKLIKEIDPHFYNRISIHQHHVLAEEFNLGRLHYTEQHRQLTSYKVLEKQQEDGFILSSSIHQLSVLPGLKYLKYVFYGPVFNSISKPGYESVVAPGFRLPLHTKGPRIIALGGITMSLIETVKQMNFDGAALLGSVWECSFNNI